MSTETSDHKQLVPGDLVLVRRLEGDRALGFPETIKIYRTQEYSGNSYLTDQCTDISVNTVALVLAVTLLSEKELQRAVGPETIDPYVLVATSCGALGWVYKAFLKRVEAA